MIGTGQEEERKFPRNVQFIHVSHIVGVLYCCVAVLLCCCIAVLLCCCIAVLLYMYCCVAVLLYGEGITQEWSGMEQEV